MFDDYPLCGTRPPGWHPHPVSLVSLSQVSLVSLQTQGLGAQGGFQGGMTFGR